MVLLLIYLLLLHASLFFQIIGGTDLAKDLANSLNSSTSSASLSSNKRKSYSLSYDDSFKSQGFIHFKIPNFAHLAKSLAVITVLYSEQTIVRGIPWRLMVKIGNLPATDTRKSLACYLQCHAEPFKALNIPCSEVTNWSCQVSATLRLLAQKEGKQSVVKSLTNIVGSKHHSWGYTGMAYIEDILNPVNGWYDPEKDTIIVEAEFRAEETRNVKHFSITSRERERSEAFKKRMKSMLNNGTGADVRFLVGSERKQETIPAHKAMLISASDKFEQMIKDQNGQEKPIKVPDVEAQTFRMVLNYIYTEDPSELKRENLIDIFSAAKKFNLASLVQACMDFLPIHPENVFYYLAKAKIYNEQSLINRCWEFIDENVYEVIGTNGFLQIDQELLTELLGRDQLMMSKKPVFGAFGESALWNAALLWAWEQRQHKNLITSPLNTRKMLGPALYKIRFPLILPKEFADKIAPSGVLTEREMLGVYTYLMNPTKPSEAFPLQFPAHPRS